MGTLEADKTNTSTKSAIINIGITRSVDGGGGSGAGNTSGSTTSDAVNTTITTTDPKLNINPRDDR